MKKLEKILSVCAILLVVFTSDIVAQLYTNGGSVLSGSQVLIGTPTRIEGKNPTYINAIEIQGDSTTYGARAALFGTSKVDGNTASGTARASLGWSSSWNAAGSIRGISAYANDVTLLDVSFNDKASSALGGYFHAEIDDPIVDPHTGTYYIAGTMSVLSGNINTLPDNGAVAAVYGKDDINSEGTWGGYFDGRGYYRDAVSIGTKSMPSMTTLNGDSYMFYVNGGGLFTEVKVATGWADYVFAKDYNLLGLEEVQNHIEEKGYLHNTPSAAEIQANGLEVGSMMTNQQEKIEELFLHLIAMNKTIKELQQDNEQLKAALSEKGK